MLVVNRTNDSIKTLDGLINPCRGLRHLNKQFLYFFRSVIDSLLQIEVFLFGERVQQCKDLASDQTRETQVTCVSEQIQKEVRVLHDELLNSVDCCTK